ncbi:MAG: M23/M56 family metallopeptidase [Oceanicaulis sp.]
MSALLVALLVSLGVGAAALLAGLKAARDGAYWTGALALTAAPLAVAALAPDLADPAAPLVQAMAPLMTGAAGSEAAQAGGGVPAASGPAIDLAAALFAVWLAGALIRAGFEAVRSARLFRAMARTAPADADTLGRVAALARRAGVARPCVRTGAGPLTTGALRPCIVLPAGFAADPAFEAVVLHELAHVRRADPLVLAMARLGGVIFWFNPFWFAAERRRRLAAELACDRAALRLSGTGGARSYARALLDASHAGSGPAAALSFGLAPRDALKMRLTDILSPAPKPPAGAAAARLAALALAAAPLAGLQIAQAATVQEAPQFTHTVLEGRSTSGYGPRDLPGYDVPRFHSGHDIAAAVGTPIRAPAAGRVTYAGDFYREEENWGRVVEIDHGDGWSTVYGHLDGFIVAEGDTVRAGQVFATVGRTGVATGPHLHVEVHVNSERVDPADHLPGLERKDG